MGLSCHDLKSVFTRGTLVSMYPYTRATINCMPPADTAALICLCFEVNSKVTRTGTEHFSKSGRFFVSTMYGYEL